MIEASPVPSVHEDPSPCVGAALLVDNAAFDTDGEGSDIVEIGLDFLEVGRLFAGSGKQGNPHGAGEDHLRYFFHLLVLFFSGDAGIDLQYHF
jgi:hypothetical protein